MSLDFQLWFFGCGSVVRDAEPVRVCARFLKSMGVDPLAKFTIWVTSEERRMHVGVYDASNADYAMRHALEAAAQAWSCDQKVLSIFGIAEGDLDALNDEQK